MDSFLTEYVAKRTEVKSATVEVWGQVTRNLRAHFGKDRELAAITESDAEEFKRYLLGLKLASTNFLRSKWFSS